MVTKPRKDSGWEQNPEPLDRAMGPSKTWEKGKGGTRIEEIRTY